MAGAARGGYLMPFLRAGFNARNRDTGIRGWTRHVDGKQFAPAELRRFQCGDFFWLGERPKLGTFLVWGEQVVMGSHWHFDLPHEWSYEYGLPHCDLDTREEHAGIDWGRYR